MRTWRRRRWLRVGAALQRPRTQQRPRAKLRKRPPNVVLTHDGRRLLRLLQQPLLRRHRRPWSSSCRSCTCARSPTGPSSTWPPTPVLTNCKSMSLATVKFTLWIQCMLYLGTAVEIDLGHRLHWCFTLWCPSLSLYLFFVMAQLNLCEEPDWSKFDLATDTCPYQLQINVISDGKIYFVNPIHAIFRNHCRNWSWPSFALMSYVMMSLSTGNQQWKCIFPSCILLSSLFFQKSIILSERKANEEVMLGVIKVLLPFLLYLFPRCRTMEVVAVVANIEQKADNRPGVRCRQAQWGPLDSRPDKRR